MHLGDILDRGGWVGLTAGLRMVASEKENPVPRPADRTEQFLPNTDNINEKCSLISGNYSSSYIGTALQQLNANRTKLNGEPDNENQHV
jgi:hypothetical protein